MIYTILPEKDTYVTNRVINNFDCSISNAGKAATLDIFKLNNENSQVRSWAILYINEQLPENNETFSLIDTKNNNVTFKFVSGEDNNNPGEVIINEDNVKIGLGTTPFTKSQLALQITDIINKVSSTTQTGQLGNQTLDITAYSSNSTILLEQNTQGELGDTLISQSLSSNLIVKKSFSRLEYSNILIKFNLDSFKNDVIKNFENSVFSNKSKFRAEIELIDITTGHSKPFDYTIASFPLSKSFDEGLGKDTISFSDIDSSNFLTASFDKSNNEYISWGTNKLLIEDVDIYHKNNNISLTSSFYVDKGDENIKLDVTEYFHQYLDGDIQDNGFSIRLGDTSLFNDSSYFVKRLGSNHLLNKKFIPRLNIKINDTEYYLPKSNDSLTKYYNTPHEFFLYNKQGGILKDIPVPSGFSNNHLSASLKYEDFILTKKGLGSLSDISKYTSIFGQEKQGIYKFSIQEDEVSRYNQMLTSSIENSTSNKFDLEWYWYNSEESQEKFYIKKEKVTFSLPENDDLTTKNMLSKITVNNFELLGNDTIQKLSVFFVDTKRQYFSNKKPIDVQCEHIENVHIRIIDTYDESILVDYEKDLNSTKLFFNGKDYEYNFFIPTIFKNKILRFEFIIIDEITDSINVIRDHSKIKVL